MPGIEGSGTIVKIGQAVTNFREGDPVLFYSTCGGACSELISIHHTFAVRKPPNITFEEAASLPVSGLTALQVMRQIKLLPSSRLLISGAAGTTGALFTQLAIHKEFESIVAVAGSKETITVLDSKSFTFPIFLCLRRSAMIFGFCLR